MIEDRLALLNHQCKNCGKTLILSYSMKMAETEGSVYVGLGALEVMETCDCTTSENVKSVIKPWPLGLLPDDPS